MEQNQEQSQITREEFNDWRDNKVTREVMKGLEQVRDDLVNFLTSGGTLPQGSPDTSFIVGRIQALDDMLKIEYEESTEEKRAKYAY